MAKEISERKVDEKLETRAQFVPSTIDKEKRTIDVVFATDTPCRTFTWEDGIVDEILSFDPGHIRMERINGGAPVLDNHNRWNGTAGVLGTVENARIEGGKAIATLRFSKREDVEGTWQDVQDGILRGISVGYAVHKYEITKEDGKRPQYRAVDWEPFEISFAPVQADPNSSVRNSGGNTENPEKNPQKQKPNTMTELEKRALAAGLPQDASQQDVEKAEAEKARKAKEAEDKNKNDGVLAERTRVKDINEICRKAGLDAAFSEKLVADGSTVEKARELAIDAVAERNETNIKNQNQTATVGKEQKEKVREAMVDAIDHRANPSEKLSEQGREFAGMSLIRMASFCLEQDGVKTRGMSEREIAIEAVGLGKRQYMSSTDFPNIMGSNVNRTLRRAYQFYQPTFQEWASRGSFKDFRAKDVIQLGDVTKMQKVMEGGEYKYGNLGDAKETYKPEKFGLIIPITWEALINDDLGAFSRIPTSIANKARQLQSDLVYSILSTNANLSDGIALFQTATHKNLAGSGAAIDITTLQAGRTAIRTQKDLNKKDVLNLTPSILIVGPASELAAYQYTSTNYVPVNNAGINPSYNPSLKVVVDPRITGNEWYLACNPNQIDTVEYSFLEGEELWTDQRMGWDVDGMEIKARMVFAAKAIDYRGLYKNPGA